MTPFELDILLHYYAHVDDHPVMFDRPPIWPETRDAFKAQGLLAEKDPDSDRKALYHLTNRGRAYIEAILAMPLPVQVWVMPNAIDTRNPKG